MGHRVGRAERRELLLDAAAALVRSGDAESVSMEAVAEEAGVSRPLVYKHFANRDELLGELYRREAAQLHDQLTADVLAAGSLEDGFRALVHGALAAAGAQGRLFAALRSAGAWSPQIRREQRARDRTTARAFTRRVVRDLGADEDTATTVVALLLSLVDPVLALWRQDPTGQHAGRLEDSFMIVVTASLGALKR